MQVASIDGCRRAQPPIYLGVPELSESLGTVHKYEVESAVYRQHDPADHWYLIVSGAARKCAQMANGRRQIMDFLLPGDLFGFGSAARRDCSVECVGANTTVVRYQRHRMESLMEADQRLARCIRAIIFGSIDRLQSRMMLLGCSRAVERVCGFLLEMAQRAQRERDGLVELPMSRYDIADYLAIAVETVSRSLTTLRSEQVITFVGTRHFRIVNLKSLEARCCR
jgi:CRP/FNR family transcriptional regulator, nitrogen fixation regulation protein